MHQVDENIIDQIYAINSYYASKGFTENYSKDWLLARHQGKDVIYIAKGDKVIAYAVGLIYPEVSKFCTLVILGVALEHLGEGYGTIILKKFLAKYPKKWIVCNVNIYNQRAANFYIAHGFDLYDTDDNGHYVMGCKVWQK